MGETKRVGGHKRFAVLSGRNCRVGPKGDKGTRRPSENFWEGKKKTVGKKKTKKKDGSDRFTERKLGPKWGKKKERG